MKKTEYIITRSKRKTLAIYVDKTGNVSVKAPLRTPKSDIERFVAEKSSWIEKSIKKVTEVSEKLRYGGYVYLLGERRPLTAVDISAPEYDGKAFRVPDGLSSGELNSAVCTVLKKIAQKYLIDRAMNVSERTGVIPSDFKITSAVTRWGSCSGKNSVCLSYRLITAPPGLIDYVIIHELSHTLHHNHSAKFWKTVQKYCPDYAERKKALHAFSYKVSSYC